MASLGQILRKPTMTFSLDGDCVRMVVFRGRHVLAWDTAAPHEEENASEAQPNGEGAPNRYVACVQDLYRAYNGDRCRVVADIPLSATLVRNFDMVRMPRRYVERVVKSEVLDTVPFAEDEVDITWQLERGRETDSVFALAAPQQAVDNRINLLKEADVRPVATYSQAMALALAVGAPEAIVVYTDSSRAGVTVIQEGKPRLIHQAPLPELESQPREVAEAIGAAVAQVTSDPETPATLNGTAGEGSVPLILTGHVAEHEVIASAVQEATHGDIRPCRPPVAYPLEFSPGEYAVNIGLALASEGMPRAGVFGNKDASTNLLAERHLPKPLPALPVAVFAILAVLASWTFSAAEQVNRVEAEAASLSGEFLSLERQVQLGQTRARVLTQKTEDVRKETAELKAKLSELRQGVDTLVARLRVITEVAPPPDMDAPNIVPRTHGFSLSGTAPDEEAVITYEANLLASRRFADVRVLRIEGPITQAQGGREDAAGKALSYQIDVLTPFASETGNESNG